ncbi:MAG: fibronectin type III domain-containing protein, partial [Bacteroidales bacterium]|nr:fibronectin type III domain-containing protein [Bacteroidales bacterium]
MKTQRLLLLIVLMMPWVMKAQNSCEITALPYFNDFENEPCYQIGGISRFDAFPQCWTRINDGTSSTYYPYISNEDDNVINGNKSMVFYNYSSYALNEYALLPPVDSNVYNSISNLHLSFYAKSSRLSAPFPMFIVGVMEQYTDTSSFVPVDTVYLTNTATLFSVSFANYSGTGKYIAIRCPRVPSSFSALLDDVYLTDQWCEPPANLTAIASHNELSLNWEANGGTSFAIVLNNNTVAGITDTFYTFSGLTENTVYQYAVAAQCNGETSPWLTGTIRTECRPLAFDDLPYTEDFEAYSYGYHVWDISPCWHKGDSRPTVNYPYPANCVVAGDTVGLSMGSSNAAYEWATLQRVDNSVDVSNLELDFLIIRSIQTSTISRLLVGVVSDIQAFEQSGLQTFVPVDTI